MTVAIYFSPEAYSTSGPKLMGRNAAGEEFLKAFLNDTNRRELYGYIENSKYVKEFENLLKNSNKTGGAIEKEKMYLLKRVETLFFPGPNISDFAYQRTIFNSKSWSICGITHTTSSVTAIDAISQLITAPIEKWDALICTSAAVKQNVEKILQSQVDYLISRLGITKINLPLLPIIPLGVNSKKFEFSEKQKKEARDKFKIKENEICVLYVGRLSFHAKSNPIAMYKTLQKTYEKTGKKIILIECGWYANEYIENAYQEARKEFCSSIRTIYIDGRKEEIKQEAWRAADIFCSFSDNIQETFGLTPIEAMAAGLPTIVSDWNGYKETVNDGIDGFKIKTIMPEPGYCEDINNRHALGLDSYDIYCGYTSLMITVDIDHATERMIELVNNEYLRKKMGNLGRENVKKKYEWKEIISSYEELWLAQTEARLKAESNDNKWPGRLDPFLAFENYSTEKIDINKRVLLKNSNIKDTINIIKKMRNNKMNNYFNKILLDELRMETLIEEIYKNNVIKEIKIDEKTKFQDVYRTLAWLIKMDIVKY